MNIRILTSNDKVQTIEIGRGTHVIETGLYTKKAAKILDHVFENIAQFSNFHLCQQNYDFRAAYVKSEQGKERCIPPTSKYLFITTTGQICISMSSFFDKNLRTEIDCRNKMMNFLKYYTHVQGVSKKHINAAKRVYVAMGFDYYDFNLTLRTSMTEFHKLSECNIDELKGEPTFNPIFQEAIADCQKKLYELNQNLWVSSLYANKASIMQRVNESCNVYNQMMRMLE